MLTVENCGEVFNDTKDCFAEPEMTQEKWTLLKSSEIFREEIITL